MSFSSISSGAIHLFFWRVAHYQLPRRCSSLIVGIAARQAKNSRWPALGAVVRFTSAIRYAVLVTSSDYSDCVDGIRRGRPRRAPAMVVNVGAYATG